MRHPVLATLIVASLSVSACSTPASLIAYIHKGAIYTVDSSGGAPNLLVDDAVHDRPLTWSPDGETLLYWKHSKVGWDIWAIDADGKRSRNLTHVTSGGCRSPSWSPDGKRIAFMRDLPAGLYVMNADGSDSRQISKLGHRDGTPAWSPDGKRIVFTNMRSLGKRSVRMELVVCDPSGQVEERILDLNHSGDAPFWLSDGHTIAYCGQMDGTPEICTVDVKKGKARAVTQSKGREGFPAQSPDSRRIAFVFTSGEERKLGVIDTGGTNARVLHTFAGRSWFPSWSPDGARLTFVERSRGSPSQVYTISSSGGAATPIATGSFPVWQPRRGQSPRQEQQSEKSSGKNGFVSIFDGKTLEGWEAMPANSAVAWTVKDGMIVGTGDKARGYIVYENREIADLELEFSYRFPGKGNSGVSIRARLDKTHKRLFQSYHADIGHVGIGRQVLGAWDFHTPGRREHECLRGDRLVIDVNDKPTLTKIEGAVAREDLKKGDWNTVRVIAKGNNFKFFINGKPASEFTEHLPGVKRLRKGMILFQLHDPGMVVHFKDIRLKILK